MFALRTILIILIIFGPVLKAERPTFRIGVILASKKDEARIAFRAAVDRANVNERDFKLVPTFGYIDTEDSFIVEKIVCDMITKGVIAIFGPNITSNSDIVSSICSSLDIPHIIYDWSPREALLDRQQATMTLNLHPDNLLLARGVADIVQSFAWRSFTVVYETDKDLQQLQDVLQISEPSSNAITVRQLGPDADHRPFLKTIKLSSDNCMVLLCSTENVLSILRQANELKMLGEYQSIFIPNLDTHTLDFEELQQVGANITTIRLIDPSDFEIKNVVHDWEEMEKQKGRYFRILPNKVKTNMILINDAITVFSKGLTELDIAKELQPPNKLDVSCLEDRSWPFGRKIIEFIKARFEEASTGRIGFNDYGQRSFFSIHVLEFEPSGFFQLATWDPVVGLDVQSSQDVSEKRVGEKLSNKTFIITSRLGEPFLSLREPKDGERLEGNARYEGYSMDLIDAIATLLNFKYEFQLAADGKYGSFNKDTQQWDGLVKELLDGNADLGICDLTMTSSRRKVVDFTPPFMTLGISILYAKPATPDTNLFSFLSPFSLDVWIYMATAFLGVSLLLYGLSRMAPADWENPHPCKEPEEVENVWVMMNTTWLTMGSLMGQGCDLLPKAASTRLVTGMWWFFALMMLNSYTANLAAFLTMSRMDNSIESAEDLASQSKIKYGVVIGGSTLAFFRDSNFSTYQKMWASMESARPSVFTKNNDEGRDRVLREKGGFAFLMESTVLEYIVERKCTLMQVGGWLDYKTYGVAMPFNSPYRKQISGAVLKLGESGTLSELKRKWWKEMHGGGKCSKLESSGGDTAELDLKNVGGVFLVLGIGLLAAIFIGVVEFLWNVKAVAIEEKISLREALKLETVFALSFWITTKPVRTSSANSSSDSNSSSSSSNLSSKRSFKSRRCSTVHSLKSRKSSAAYDREHRLSTQMQDKIRKISSMFSLKSLRSDHNDAAELGSQEKIDKATQVDGNPNGLAQQHDQHDSKRHQHHRESKAGGQNGKYTGPDA